MLKTTKNFIFFSVVLSLILSSCKKDPTDVPIGTISVAIDGKTTTFNYGAKAGVANVTPAGSSYGIYIQGNKRDPSTSRTNLMIFMVKSSAVSTGTYVESSGGSFSSFADMHYFYDWFFGSGDTSIPYGSTSHPVTVIITDINSTSVKGTFSGELQYTSGGFDGKTTGKHVFANGVFYVRF